MAVSGAMVVAVVMAVMVARVMVMDAEAMVVIAGLMALLGHHLVAFEQPHTQ